MTLAEEEIAFHSELGRALAAWADIEARLLDAVLRCFSTDENGMFARRAVAMGFVSLQGFKNKLLFTGATFQRALSGSPHADDWRSCKKNSPRTA